VKPLRGPLLALVLAAALAGAARGHDFWVRPSSFRPGLADRIEVDLRVGQGFRGEPVARNPERIAAFFAVRRTGVEEPIVGIDGKAPAGFLRAKPAQDPGKGGLVWIAYRSRPASLELPAEKFESYLADEGLERIVEMRGSLGERAEPGREAYVRCAKSLVVAGPGAGAGFGATFGLPLEIVLEKDPASLAPDEPLCVRLLFRDQPLEGRARRLRERDGPRVGSAPPHGRRRPRPVRPRRRRRPPPARRAHGAGRREPGRGLGELLGVADVRDRARA
jgi:hypothetical protein